MIGTFFLYIEKIQYSCHVILENFDQQIYTTAKSFSTKIIFFKICITNLTIRSSSVHLAAVQKNGHSTILSNR